MNLFNDGILIDLDISYWSGARILKPEDLGLRPEEVADAFKLGRKMLVPYDVIRGFRKTENKARRLINNLSFSFPIGGARFIPKAKEAEVTDRLDEFRGEYLAQVESLISNYEGYKEAMKPVYRLAAIQAYKKVKNRPDQMDIPSEEEYIEQFLNRIESHYPAESALRGKFALDWSVFEIAVPNSNKYSDKINRKLSSFIDEVVGTLRGETIKVCGKLASNIAEGKIVKANSIRSLKGFIDRFSSLNFVGDSEIEARLKELRTNIIDKYSTDAIEENMDIQTALKDKLDVLVEKAGNIDDTNRVSGGYKRRILWESK